jgi:adapter protein MecA 1/2
MKIERVNRDKIRIYLSAEELVERGIKRDEMVGPFPHLHDLLMEMMEKAADEIGFEAEGPLAVEVFSMASQGMVLVVTRPARNNKDEAKDDGDDDDYDLFKSFNDNEIEVDVTIETQNKFTYVFSDFENVLAAMKRLYEYDVMFGQLYYYQNRYIVQIKLADLNTRKVKGRSKTQKETERKKVLDYVETVLQDFGDVSFVTEAVLEEYGKHIIEEHAVKTLYEKMNLGPVKKTRRPRVKKDMPLEQVIQSENM